MKKHFSYCILSYLILFGANRTDAQEPTNSTVDSIQRIIMRDSLQISDSLITMVFGIRNNYLQQSQVIRNSSSLSDTAKNSAVRTLGMQTNQSIKSLLGDETFSRYEAIINYRMRQRMNNRRPLADNQ